MSDPLQVRFAIATHGGDLAHQLVAAVASNARIGLFMADATGGFTVIVGDGLIGLDPETHGPIRTAVRRALAGESVVTRFADHGREYELQCLPLRVGERSRGASGVLIDLSR